MLAGLKSQPLVRNAILASLSQDDLAGLRSFLQPIALKERTVLQDPRRSAEYVYFIETGVVSLRTLVSDTVIETALVGREAIVDITAAMGARAPTYQSIVLFPGQALRIRAPHLHQLMTERPQIREKLLHHLTGLLFHSAQRGLCCAKHASEDRIACWLCLASDQLRASALPITQDQISTALGIRRATVTNTLLDIEESGVVRRLRGMIEIMDRERLEEATCPCYGAVKQANYAQAAMVWRPAFHDGR